MATLQLRLTGDDDAAQAMLDLLKDFDGVEWAEDVADLEPDAGADDEDSSSAGLSDNAGPGNHMIRVEIADDSTRHRVLAAAQTLAEHLGTVLEIDDE
ncbi:hypothetical protein [Stenotrophomonas sp. Iso1]|uniref:hypothetical protein n=1 Tax=Stenotrophomonas sp. Iso1 TaxID=2977283 RepID=UPI0022B78773|nr:hypothetical protein [Stenotrophomonas sp. Iso1]